MEGFDVEKTFYSGWHAITQNAESLNAYPGRIFISYNTFFTLYDSHHVTPGNKIVRSTTRELIVSTACFRFLTPSFR